MRHKKHFPSINKTNNNLAEKTNDGKKTKRRVFLKQIGGLAAGFPFVIPSVVLGENSPSNRLTVGVIGTGGMGTTDMKVFMRRDDIQVLAVCDVDKKHREDAKNEVIKKYSEKSISGKYEGCAEYNDFRDIIERDDIDIVIIATPDHWHAIPAVMAANAGKNIYCEKPVSHTIEDGRAISNAVRRNGVVFQTGSWQRSALHFRDMVKIVKDGAIGKVHTVTVGLYKGESIGIQPVMPVPEGFDYDFWLGPAPWAPYTEKRCHGNFRYNLDYSGGKLLDFVPHHCDIAQWGLGTDLTGPVEFDGNGDFPKEGIWNGAVTYHIDCVYADGTKMILDIYDDKNILEGVKFEGSDGTVYIGRYDMFTRPESLIKDFRVRPIPQGEEYIQPVIYHVGDFINCIKNGGVTKTPAEVAHRSASIGHLANISMLLKKRIRWDPDKEQIIGDSAAERMLRRPMRSPWSLS